MNTKETAPERDYDREHPLSGEHERIWTRYGNSARTEYVRVDLYDALRDRVTRLEQALRGLLEVCSCQNGCAPDDMSCATNFARAALNDEKER